MYVGTVLYKIQYQQSSFMYPQLMYVHYNCKMQCTLYQRFLQSILVYPVRWINSTVQYT